MKIKPGFYLLLLAPILLLAQEKKDVKQYAPADAFIENSSYPFYGSASKWGKQMFSGKRSKRRGQQKMLAILEGKPQDVLTMCEEDLLEDPNDTESLYMLTLAWLELGKLDKAFETMKKSLTAGLPFERFLAGPRELLKPLTESEPFKQLLTSYQNQLIHGPMLGSMSDSSVCFWLRTLAEVPVTVRLSKDNGDSWFIESNPVLTKAEKDYTTIIEMSGIEPNKVYTYDIQIDGKSSLNSQYPAFKTFPSKGHSARFKLAFGGGAGYTPEHERMWDTISANKPDAFLFLGDNVYIDLPEMPGEFHNYTYYRRQSRPEYRRLIRSVPIYAIWDDHDSAINDVWLGPYLEKPDWKLPMLQVFKNNWNNPAYGSDDRPACWFKFSYGNVDFFMLDCRFYRTNPLIPNPSMLGLVQKDWLLDGLEKSKAGFKVLASSVPWAYNTKPGSYDTWDGYDEEREEIFSFIDKKNINGVILLSADRHRSDVWVIHREQSYDLYEFESSKLTNIHTHKKMPGAKFSYNEKCSFGLLSFDTTKDDPEVIYQIVNIDNEVVYSITVNRSQLE